MTVSGVGHSRIARTFDKLGLIPSSPDIEAQVFYFGSEEVALFKAPKKLLRPKFRQNCPDMLEMFLEMFCCKLIYHRGIPAQNCPDLPAKLCSSPVGRSPVHCTARKASPNIQNCHIDSRRLSCVHLILSLGFDDILRRDRFL